MSSKAFVDKWHEQGMACSLSGLPLLPHNVAVDHIVARSAGGTDLQDNLQLVDAKVNQMKGVLPQQEFIDLCARVTAHNLSKVSPEIQEKLSAKKES